MLTLISIRFLLVGTLRCAIVSDLPGVSGAFGAAYNRFGDEIFPHGGGSASSPDGGEAGLENGG
jgi:hypothetical protein